MWISTKSKYGLQLIYELGSHWGDKPIPLSVISEKYGISISYLEQITALLKKDGIVKSTRGPTGGYTLVNHPKEITLGEIILSLEGSMAPVVCIDEAGECTCEGLKTCVTKEIFETINEKVTQYINHISVEDMIKNTDNKQL